jgi:hypothetical protein
LLLLWRVGGKQILVFLERRAAAGGVGDDGVEFAAEEDAHVDARQIASDVADSGVRRQRTAADLAGGHDDLAAVGGEHANRCFVQLRETDLCDAAGEKCNAGSFLAFCGERSPQLREEEGILDLRHQAVALGHAKQLQEADITRQSLGS